MEDSNRHGKDWRGSFINGHKPTSCRSLLKSDQNLCDPTWEVLANDWHRDENTGGFVNLGTAENTLVHREIEDHIKSKLPYHADLFRYGKDGFLGSKRLRSTMALFLTKWMTPIKTITAEQIAVTSGVTAAIEARGWGLMDNDDAVLVGRPYYPGFPIGFGARVGVKIIPVSFGAIDPFDPEAITRYEEALLGVREQGIRVKGLLICNPHNPLGRCYPRQTLIAIMRFCQTHGLHLISDEIYALSVWKNEEALDATAYESVLAVNEPDILDPSRVHVLWGLSKDFGLNGIRIGCIVSQANPRFFSALKEVSLFTGPSSLAEHIAADILSDGHFAERCIVASRERLGANYAFAARYLRDHGFHVYPYSNAGLFLWVKLKPLESFYASNTDRCRSTKYRDEKANPALDDVSLVNREIGVNSDEMSRLKAAKVLLSMGEEFGAEGRDWFRIVLSLERSYLKEGLERVVRALCVNVTT